MITDDARIVDAHACQVESWVKRNADSTEYWAMPACNPWGNVELTFGGARTSAAEGSGLTDELLQMKTILHPLEANGWGAGLAMGTVRRPRREAANDWPGDAYFYVPVSVSLAGERWIAHFNAGAANRRDLHRTLVTWGFGNEILLSEKLFFIPEVFRNDFGKPFYQAGLRYWVKKDHIQVDATYGNRAVSDTGEHWFSIGLRLISPPFLR